MILMLKTERGEREKIQTNPSGLGSLQPGS